ncbi:MAG: 2-C-methyl-D-erythritol 2,4-cyclodiphosphate synthase [Chloroflexi bacterium]|nr:2-C-methyl-D-erythritol 2,4-cyclodiphosphate synthase [Chloroflexota bacterium]
MTGSDAGFRIGIGYDVHRLVEGRKLILGGVAIPHHLGLLGFSDADVLLHAIIDAMLGAAALGDIGQHFPPGDPRFKDISSLFLLERANEMLLQRELHVGNVDATVVAEAPILLPHIPAMRQSIAGALKTTVDRVSVKGKSNEGLGFAGRGEGITAYAVALLKTV